MLNYINGASSLLFIISTIKSFYCSKLLTWKLSNIFLIIASFLCNATEYRKELLIIDYFAIYLVCLSYINNVFINTLFSVFIIYEYYKYNSVEGVKNITFLTALLKSIIYTYLYINIIYYYILCISAIIGILVYVIRLILIKKNNIKYKLLLTYIFHICIMTILYISSITAI